MGIHQCYSMSCVYPSVNRATGSYVLHLDSKNLPGQMYNDTVAIAIGRKPVPSSYTLMCFLTLRWDRKPGRATKTGEHD